MYAVVKTGATQHLVREGDELLVEKIVAEKDSSVSLEDVLFLEEEGKHKVGQPTISGAKVVCKVVKQERGPKLIIFKLRRRKNSRRKNGHRQFYTRLLVEKIESGL